MKYSQWLSKTVKDDSLIKGVCKMLILIRKRSKQMRTSSKIVFINHELISMFAISISFVFSFLDYQKGEDVRNIL